MILEREDGSNGVAWWAYELDSEKHFQRGWGWEGRGDWTIERAYICSGVELELLACRDLE